MPMISASNINNSTYAQYVICFWFSMNRKSCRTMASAKRGPYGAAVSHSLVHKKEKTLM